MFLLLFILIDISWCLSYKYAAASSLSQLWTFFLDYRQLLWAYICEPYCQSLLIFTRPKYKCARWPLKHVYNHIKIISTTTIATMHINPKPQNNNVYNMKLPTKNIYINLLMRIKLIWEPWEAQYRKSKYSLSSFLFVPFTFFHSRRDKFKLDFWNIY